MEELLKNIVKHLKVSSGDEILLDRNLKKKITKENFREIEASKTGKPISYVDGGSSEIIKSPSLSLFFSRIYYCTYESGKRVSNKRTEFYTLLTSRDNKITASCFPGILEIQEFDAYDKELTTGESRISLEKIGSLIRRLAELKTASEIKSDYVVIDGSLEAQHKSEKKYLTNLKNAAGLSKTTSLVTKKGLSAAGYLNRISPFRTWFFRIDNLYFLKLHPNSKYVFRLDYCKKDYKELIWLLSNNSTDPIFLGYPYGLVEADRMARISNKETSLIRLQLKTKLKKDFEEIEPHLSSLDSHDVLDNIS